MTFYRVQSADRDTAELLDPTGQFSRTWGAGRTNVGVSVCDTLEDLAEYLASHLGCGIPVQAATWVIVELSGNVIPGSAPVDPEFESLIIPTEIVRVRPVDDEFMAMIAKAAEFLAGFDNEILFDEE
jgi:hypothetical protein